MKATEQHKTGKLIVGRASAGSGKTFTLTLEYIRLLVENPDNYRRILAVTFTNKATAELKSRIIDTLHAIATGHPKAQSYTQYLCHAGDTTHLQHTCSTALKAILHDYSHFRVETIDSFFQSIIRELARELNLTANLRIDLDQDEALTEAVALMMEQMKRGDNTFNAVVGYVTDKINSQKPTNWKIDKELIEFSHNIFNEHYLKAEKDIRHITADQHFYPHYKQALINSRHSAEEQRKATAQTFINHTQTFGLTPDMFVRGSKGVYAYFPKVAEGKAPKDLPKALLDDPYAPWLKDTLLNNRHAELFRQLINQDQQLRRTLATINAKLKHANQMQLLSKVDDTLRQQNEEHNRFILADTAHRLNEIMSDTDVPFIMEKAAAQFRYIMIDEFQDTSELQWKNFQPLIKECLANGCRCIIVGDVKQSIYRWRNSDWGILNDIGHTPPFSPMVDETSMRHTLDTNRRSAGHIVEFNNKFFRQASKDVATHFQTEFSKTQDCTSDIQAAYADLEQKIEPRKQGQGYVSITEIPADNEESTTTDNQQAQAPDRQQPTDKMLEYVEQTIIHLTQNSGINYNDIAILTRHNAELRTITQHLQQHIPDIRIVSSEAFQLNQSEAIKLIILALQAIAETNSNLTPFLLGTLAWKYQTLILGNHNTDTGQYFETTADQLASKLPEEFIKHIDQLQMTPLRKLCERIYDIFQLDTIDGQAAYMFTFFDELSAFINDKTTNINTFLQYWDDTLSKKTIPAEGAEGIQMLTIHRSKGLEFHTVILPYCNWKMGGKPAEVLWCKNNTPEGELPVIPVAFGKTLSDTDFKTDYEDEQLKNYVDNLNLMYVAFTRASNNLIVITQKPKNNEYSTYDILASATKQLCMQDGQKPVQDNLTAMQDGQTVVQDNLPADTDTIDFTIGSPEPHTDTSPTPSKNIAVEFHTGGINAVFRQSNASKEFTTDPESADTDEAERQTYIKRGLVVHNVFENIHTAADIPQAMRQLEQQGVMADTAFQEEIEAEIKKAMKNPQVSRWFDPGWTVMNECSIIVRDKNGDITTQRPDRVIYNGHETIVVDYKTGRPDNNHDRQVKDYMELLRQMGMTNVKGYIWYMRTGEIKDVI